MNKLIEMGLLSTILTGCTVPSHPPDLVLALPITNLDALCPTPTPSSEFPCIAPDGERIAVGRSKLIELITSESSYKLMLTCQGSLETPNGGRFSIFGTDKETFEHTGASGITTIFNPRKPERPIQIICRLDDNCKFGILSVPQPQSTPIPRRSMTGRLG